ncbi:DeoR family transcriptional regulator [Scopulibacillus darangshiensis]|uniref:DeoR family transcriptional regulator n=1 Tax=Scopulibacillus darangshiensis TaxID=442528 RepID=A0A4R2P5S1_9BACL|nr:DeoR/GlpR family DNA-binding transcription regulator [Scopulibacillus darangshiensis]TCP29474.1 DeoR family transcriptional regulator [Scopulibacillus darangshiensis]
MAQRRNKIKELVLKEGSVKVSELVKVFQVSEETIRRDLTQLEQEGLLKKNYGGAMLIEKEEKNDNIPPVRQRQNQYSEEKDAIGRRAAELVKDGEIVILDAGSTTWYTARHLKNKNDLTIISNGLNVVDQCSENTTYSVYMLGGKLRRNSMSFVGPQAETELKNYSADYVFLGTSGISLNQGFTSSDLYEAKIKSQMATSGDKIIILADHSKLSKAGLVSFCEFGDIDMLITSELADRAILQQIRQHGVEVIAVPLSVETSNPMAPL